MRNRMLKSALFLALLAAVRRPRSPQAPRTTSRRPTPPLKPPTRRPAALRNQWTTTAATLAAAKKSADAGDFDKATASAKEAEALAKASIFQATSEKTRWKDMEIR